MVGVITLHKSPISKLQEYAQQGRIFCPRYEDLTASEGKAGYKFVVVVHTRTRVVHNQNHYQGAVFRVPQFQCQDYSCKGYGSSKKEAKTNAAAKLLGQLYGVKIPYPTSSSVNTEPGTKNPISVVQEYSQKHKLKPVYTESVGRGMFKCTLVLGCLDTTGQGMNKKAAKCIAAQAMVKLLENIKEDSDELKPLKQNGAEPPSKTKTRAKAKRRQDKEEVREEKEEDRPLFDMDSGKHPISLIQEFCQKKALEIPLYTRKGVFSRTVAHGRYVQNFDILATMRVAGLEIMAPGSGTTVKAAREMAARNLITRLEGAREDIKLRLYSASSHVTSAPDKGEKKEKEVEAEKTEEEKIKELDPDSQMNALQLVNQLYKPEISIEEVPDKPDHRKEFEATFKVGEKEYKASANSKKRAKLLAAAVCLEEKAGHLQYSTTAMNQSWRADEFTPEELGFAKTIANLVHQKYELVMRGTPEYEQKRKVLAGVLIRSAQKIEVEGGDDLQVLVVSTGTKCVDGEHLSSSGCALNDSHAEVLARRAFKRFLLEQVKRFHNEESSILEKSKTPPFLLTVKPELSFHLFISTAPCGDARVYTRSSPGDDGSTRGALRSKIECGEGTIPVSNMPPVQTWDGLIAGERLATMSCSDKMAVWNAVGVQGALLAHFLEPVHFDTVVIGGCFSLCHLTRALVTRVQREGAYSVHKPLVLPVAQQETRVASKSSGYAMNWILGDGSVEMTKTNTGMRLGDSPSRLCKNLLFRKFNDVCGVVLGSSPYQGKLYSNIKEDATNYQVIKGKVYETFKSGGQGAWIRKPIEQNMFTV